MKLSRFIPSLIWMGVIFYFSTQPTSSIQGDESQRFLILKTFHLIEYAILAILLYYGTQKYRHAIVISYLYALSDEFHQRFTIGRTSKFSDTLIDLLGIVLGLFILKIFLKKINFRVKHIS